MSQLIVKGNVCNRCGAESPSPVNFCGNCGLQISNLPAAVSGSINPPSVNQHASPQIVIVSPSRMPAIDRALNNRLIVFAILLLAGPIGLPALWFSGRFSSSAKVITTLLYVALTVLLPIAAIIYYLEVSLWPLVRAFGE